MRFSTSPSSQRSRQQYKWPEKSNSSDFQWDFPFTPQLFSEFCFLFLVPRPPDFFYSFSDLSAGEVVPKVDDALEHKVRHKVDWCINGVQLEQLTCEAVRSAARWVCHCCKSTTSIPLSHSFFSVTPISHHFLSTQKPPVLPLTQCQVKLFYERLTMWPIGFWCFSLSFYSTFAPAVLQILLNYIKFCGNHVWYQTK